MKEDFYKRLVESSPIGYAYHKIVCGNDGTPCDYEFIEVNPVFEALMGLRGSDIVGRKITEVFPDIGKREFDWIKFYGKIAINDYKNEFELYSETLKRWYRVTAYSPEKHYIITCFIDISKEKEQAAERKSLQDTVKETEFEYKIISDLAYDWETWEDETGRFRHISPSCEKTSGYTINEFSGDKSLFASLIIEEDKELWANHRHCIEVDKGLHNLQFRIRNKSGQIVWIEHICRPVTDENGKNLGYRANNRDITKRKLAEEALRESEEEYRLLFENAVEAIVVFQNYKVKACNPMAQQMSGYSKTELMALSFIDLVYCEDLENATNRYKMRMKNEGGEFKLVFRFVKKNKEIIWVESSSVEIHWKGNKALLSFFADITERKNAEEVLQSSRRQLSDIVEFLPDATLAINKERQVIIWNKAIEIMTGIPAAEMIGKGKYAYSIPFYGKARSLLLDLCFQDEKEVLRRYPNISHNGNAISSEAFCPALNGNTGAWVSIKASPLHDLTGNIIGAIESMRDISDQKLEEKEILFLSYHDQLTGLYNRRFYEEELTRLDTKRNIPLTIIMGDVNGLKLINDSFGHAMGDELLKKVAGVITKGCRADDIIARLGGDEFVIILPKTDALKAAKVINRINALLKKEKVANIDISISFGHETKNNEKEEIQSIYKDAEDYMYRKKRSESLIMRSKTVQLVLQTLYDKNKREQLHSIRVSEFCENIAIKMDLDKEDVYQIRIAGLMHDIGKIEIDETILNKPQKLDDDEWQKIRKHSEIGYQILSSVNEFSKIADYVLEHHERWDGKGYPRGLKGKEILLQARIITIADAYDAMTRSRTYDKALSEEEAVKEMIECSGTQFDPEIARIFIEKVLEKEW